ncbi:MAG TPA: hypothetical protein PKO28_00475 [Bacilli bacterium]|nr:hypothetical protein [Bacilli bacterium]
MKKEEKLSILDQSKNAKELCRCFFKYDCYYFYYYVLDVNNKFMLGQEEDDFLLDGYAVRKISDLTRAEIRNDLCNKMNQTIGVVAQIANPNIDITSWEIILKQLAKLNKFISIEDEYNEKYFIGVVFKVNKSDVLFRYFDADGVWSEKPVLIKYSNITCVKWDNRYISTWKKYKDLLNE